MRDFAPAPFGLDRVVFFSDAVVRNIRLNLLLPPVVFLLSAGVAAFNANLAMYAWFLLIPVYVFRRHTETVLMGKEAP